MDNNTIIGLVVLVLILNSAIGSVIGLWRLRVDKRITDNKWSTLWNKGGIWGKTGIIFYGFSIAPVVIALMFAASFIMFAVSFIVSFPICWVYDRLFK